MGKLDRTRIKRGTKQAKVRARRLAPTNKASNGIMRAEDRFFFNNTISMSYQMICIHFIVERQTVSSIDWLEVNRARAVGLVVPRTKSLRLTVIIRCSTSTTPTSPNIPQTPGRK